MGTFLIPTCVVATKLLPTKIEAHTCKHAIKGPEPIIKTRSLFRRFIKDACLLDFHSFGFIDARKSSSSDKTRPILGPHTQHFASLRTSKYKIVCVKFVQVHTQQRDCVAVARVDQHIRSGL